MSHCTKFDFQFTSRKCIIRTFESLGLDWREEMLYQGCKLAGVFIPLQRDSMGIIASRAKFNYLMQENNGYYKLFIEKHNMTADEEFVSKQMAEEFRQMYIQEVAKEVVRKMNYKGENAILEKASGGYEIKFGQLYDKSIFIKFSNGRVIEEVQGVKGDKCVSLTEALENMLSSADVELQSEWTDEYYEDDSECTLKVYNLEQMV